MEKKIHVILHMEIAGSKYGDCLMLCIWYLIHTHSTNTCCVPTVLTLRMCMVDDVYILLCMVFIT